MLEISEHKLRFWQISNRLNSSRLCRINALFYCTLSSWLASIKLSSSSPRRVHRATNFNYAIIHMHIKSGFATIYTYIISKYNMFYAILFIRTIGNPIVHMGIYTIGLMCFVHFVWNERKNVLQIHLHILFKPRIVFSEPERSLHRNKIFPHE